MPDLDDLDRNIGPLYPVKPSRKPEPRDKPEMPDRRQRRRRPPPDADDSRPRIDEYV